MPRRLSRRVLTHRLGEALFVQPRPDEYYWVKHLNPPSRAVVLVRPDAAGQESLAAREDAESLYLSLVEAFRACDEQHNVRNFRGNKVAVFDLGEDGMVGFDVRDVEL